MTTSSTMAVGEVEATPLEGSRRRKPAITRRVIQSESADEDDPLDNRVEEHSHVPVASRKPTVTRRIVTSESDSDDCLPAPFINSPSSSQTPIDRSKVERTRISPAVKQRSPSNDKEPVATATTGLKNRRSIQALTGVKDGFVFRIAEVGSKLGREQERQDSRSEEHTSEKPADLVSDYPVDEEIPEGTLVIEPEAAPDGEEDWYNSVEFRKQFPREKREKKEQLNSGTGKDVIDSVFCTSCSEQVNPFDKRTFHSHPVLGVVICKKCLDFYDSGPWKRDSEGIEEQCRWCGEGGNLTCCDFCPRTFCKPCIKRNLGRKEMSRIEKESKWQCYVCNPLPLKELKAKCSSLLSNLSRKVKTQKEKQEKIKVETERVKQKPPVPNGATKKVAKQAKKTAVMTDSDIAEEFLQYLVGNVSGKAFFMHSLMRLKNEVPQMQKAQMELSLKNLGAVKAVLNEFESVVKRSLHGDINKSDSALDGTDTEDCDSPERKSKFHVSDSHRVRTDLPSDHMTEERKHVSIDKTMQVCEMSCAEVASSKALKENSEQRQDVQDACRLSLGTTSNSDTQPRDITVDETQMEVDVSQDCAVQQNVEENDIKKEQQKVNTGDDNNDDKLPSSEKSDPTLDNAVSNPDTKEVGEKNDESNLAGDEGKESTRDCLSPNVCEDSHELVNQHSPRKLKVTPRLSRESQSPRSRTLDDDKDEDKESHDDEDDFERLMSMISETDSDDESDGSCYSPHGLKKLSKKKNTPKKETKPSEKVKQSMIKKEEVLSSEDFDDDEGGHKKRGPGLDSSNVEEESGFDGIPNASSADHTSGEGEDAKKTSGVDPPDGASNTKTAKKKLFKKKGFTSSSSELDSSESETGNIHSRGRKEKEVRPKVKKRSRKPSSSELSEDEKEVQRLESLSHLKRKRKRQDTDEESNGKDSKVQDDSDQSNPKNGVDCPSSAHESSVEDKVINDAETELSVKKEKKSPAKCAVKSKEFLSTDTSSDDSDSDSDENSGLRWKSLNKNSKKQESLEDIEERLLMDEIDDEDDDDDDDDDEDDNDDDQEMDGAGSKRSKKQAQKRKPEDEESLEEDGDWGTNENHENGEGMGGGGSGGKDDDDNKDEDKSERNKDKDEEDGEDGDENEDEDEGADDDSEDEVTVKKKTHPLLQVRISGSGSSSEGEKPKKGQETKAKKQSKNKGKTVKKKKKVVEDTDDYFTSSESDDVPKRRSKRKRATQSQTASSTEDSSKEQKKGKKKVKRVQGTSSEADSSKEFQPARRAKGGKGKKRRRIKEPSDSESGEESKTQEDDDDKAASTQNGNTSEEDENDTPKKGRKQIRRVLKKSKLKAETLAAEAEEQERRKRVLEKRREIIAEEDEKAEKSAVVKSCVLEKDKESSEVLLDVDQELTKQLKPHQVDGVQFLYDSTFESLSKAEEQGGGCILAHCMGLGKTLQVITYLHTVMNCEKLGIKTCLVVAPLNTVLNWQDEFQKWLGEMDDCMEVYEMSTVKNNWARADLLNRWFNDGGVMIMGYSMYRNLSLLTHVRNKKQKATFRKTLVEPGPQIVVCDEGHMLKNDNSAISKAMNSIHTKRRICLTGTPLQNNLIEYHCMVNFVKPNLLGTMREFKNRFVNPITNGQHSDSTLRDVKIMKRRAHVLHNLLSGCVQRKDYSALTKFLPPKHEFVVSIRLTPVQIKLYEHYLNNLSGRKEDGSKTQTTSLFADYQVLMNVWTHPRLLQLATAREDRAAAKREMDNFVTSDEYDDEEDSVKEFVISSDSDLEDPWKSSRKKRGKDSIKSESSPRSSRSRSRGANDDGSQSSDENEDDQDNHNSDSSVEVVKTWNTRSRAKESGLSEGASTSAEVYIPPEPVKSHEWYSDFIKEDDEHNIELSGKLILLFEILRMAESMGEKVLVFSQSLLSLDMIEEMLAHLDDKAEEERANGEQDLENQIGGIGSWVKGEDYFRMDGSTPAHLRQRWSEIFNDLENIRARLFLISTKAGSLGINLVAANRVIIFDANWNPSHDVQSIFRVYRFGQTRSSFIYRFIAQGTMEEKIYDRQVIKQALAQRVVDEHQIERHFTSADLSELYNFTPDRLDDPNRPEQPTPVLPKDYVLAELLKHKRDVIVKYHEHDSLLENIEEEELTEEERKAAWSDYDAEKNGQIPNLGMMRNFDPQDMERIYKEGESILRMGEMMLNYPGQSTSVSGGGNPLLPMGGPGVSVNHIQRVLEMQSLYRAQIQHQQRQQQLQREHRLQQQRLLMLQQAGQFSSSSLGEPGSLGMRQLQHIAQYQQQQRMLQNQRLQQQQQQQQQQQPQQQQAQASGTSKLEKALRESLSKK
ncbi:uncharacterized protein [Diadema antillarum]|uniref:uncharacterized protein isoform X2 n=1 Tax=Diadema antillarum TaxID=105358 RepID=UPI003A89066E